MQTIDFQKDLIRKLLTDIRIEAAGWDRKTKIAHVVEAVKAQVPMHFYEICELEEYISEIV